MIHHLPTLRSQFSSTFAFVRKHGRDALGPLFGFSLVLAAQIAGLVLTALRFGAFSESPSPSDALAMGVIGVTLVLTIMVTAFANWAWVVCWARGAGKHPALRSVVLRLVGLYVLYKVVAGFPGVLLGAAMDERAEPLLQITLILWTLFVVSRGIPALLYVARDRMGVFAAISKSMQVTKGVWLRVFAHVAAGWALLVACIMVVVIAAVALKVSVPMSVEVTAALGTVLFVTVMQAVLVMTLSYVMRLAEAITH